MIYYLLRARCFSHQDAYDIAFYSQNVDDNPFTSPMELGKKVILGDPVAAQLLSALHFHGSTPTSGTSPGHPSAVVNASFAFGEWENGGSGDPRDIGSALHTLADTWAHRGFTAWKNPTVNGQQNHPDLTERYPLLPHVGHLTFSHDPDEPWRRPLLALAAAKAIYFLTPDRCGCAPGVEYNVAMKDLLKQFGTQGSLKIRCAAASKMIQDRFTVKVDYPGVE